MLTITGLSKSYSSQVLFDGIDFILNRGERVGLVGRNGHGKSTLLKIITGEEQADEGRIQTPDGYRLGHLEQHIHFTHGSALEEVESVMPELEGGWKETHRAELVMQGLGFSAKQLASDPAKLSGGFQIRINLAKLLVSDVDLLLLDEPTNYLDVVSIRWISSFLKQWKGELIIITHDRHFLDNIVTHIAGIHRRGIKKIAGGTTQYYAQVEQEEIIHEQSRVNQEARRAHTEKFVNRFRAKASKASAVQSRVKALEKEEVLEKRENIDSLDFKFSAAEFKGKNVLEIKNLAFGYNEKLIEDLSVVIRKQDRIGVVGPNGKGKSTLLRLLAEDLKQQGGEIVKSTNTKISFFGQTNIQRLSPERTVEEEILDVLPEQNRTIARGICGLMMFQGDLALKKVEVLSGGEKSRVLLGKLLATPSNVLLLDEPTSHLDLESSQALIDAIDSFPGAIIIVTHNEGVLERVADRLIVFDRGKVTLFGGGYKDFLQRVGWADEDGLKGQKGNANPKIGKKELRRRKANRNETLKPLKMKMDAAEKKIEELDAFIAEGNTKLIDAAKDGFGERAGELSREIHQAKQDTEQLFEELEKHTVEYEQKDRELSLTD